MKDLIIKILVELISVLALASKQIKQGRLSKYALTYIVFVTQCVAVKFAKMLLRETEIKTVVQRLDRLTQDEARMIAAETFGVVHGLMGNITVVMEGAQLLYDCLRIFV